MEWRSSLILIAVCIAPELEGCKVYCIGKEYQDALYVKGKCLCFDLYPYDMTKLPVKNKNLDELVEYDDPSDLK